MGASLNKPDSCSNRLENPANFITILRCFKLVLKKVLFKILHKSKDKADFYPNTAKSQQQMKSAILPTSEAKALLKEILDSLDLIENYLQCPSEETASPLRSLFDHGKSDNEYFTPEKIEEFLEILRTMTSARVKELEDENKSLKIENQEILEVLGEILVEKMAKDNKEKRSKSFQKIFPPSVLGGDVVGQRGNHEPGKENMVTKDEDERDFQGAEQQSNNQRSTQQGYDLPFSIQQEDGRGREHISLGHIPPTSVATTVYNNYKLLLLSLAINLTSIDVMILKNWASENFLIENAQNATHVLLQLDEKEVIHASDLSQLRNFFELISRTDLVHAIDVFLLGDYNSVQQMLNERRTTEGNAVPRISSSTRSTVGSNGLKHSTLRRPVTKRNKPPNSLSPQNFQSPTLDHEEGDKWSCSHYKRHCHVKFECCDIFWPCHRCHNSQSTCGQRKRKAPDTKMVKCDYCNKVQQFGQFCSECGAQFAEYFCGTCKHLTGTDDHPYHCEKCGICRINGDRAFHCDVCGVCMDVQLLGNHKCRQGSAHDECCICVEDCFSGCQILPCSHKAHKGCVSLMIRNGVTRCPICRQSFAHKIERRKPRR